MITDIKLPGAGGTYLGRRQCPNILPGPVTMGYFSSSDSVASSLQRRLTELTDDFWYEIFLHLPLDSIYRFRCVSKVWLSILSNPKFITQWNQLNTASSLWALLHVSISKVALSYPELNSQLISHRQSGFSFKFINHNSSNTTNFKPGLCIIGSSNGLVLLTDDYLIQKTYYVCNPLTKKSVLLPPPPAERSFFKTGFTCEETCSSSLISTSFKVIRVPVPIPKEAFKVEIFSSDLGEWNVYDCMYPPGPKQIYFYADNLVIHNGVFYWMQKLNNKVLAFDMNKNNNNRIYGIECRLIHLPDRTTDDEYKHSSNFLGESEGLICYAVIKHTERSLSVWILEEDWYSLHKDMKLYDILAQESWLIRVFRDVKVLGFNPFDKNVVILGYYEYIWAYNIRTGGYEKLSHPSCLSNFSAHDVGLLTFPLSLRPTTLPPVTW